MIHYMVIMESNNFINIKISSIILIAGVLEDEVITFNGVSTGRFVEVTPFTLRLSKLDPNRVYGLKGR